MGQSTSPSHSQIYPPMLLLTINRYLRFKMIIVGLYYTHNMAYFVYVLKIFQ